MGSELWEEVRADQLKVGDTVRWSEYSARGEITAISPHYTGIGMVQTVSGVGGVTLDGSGLTVYRRYTGPSLEVLIRALENACSLDQWLPGESRKLLAEKFIEEAQAEIEREANDQA